MEYEDIPFKIPLTVGEAGGRRPKMAKSKKSDVPVAKVRKVYTPSRLEVAKTVTIAVLITAVVAFIAGAQYQGNREAELHQAIESARAEMVEAPEATPVKK